MNTAPAVKVGDKVVTGQAIGVVGSTGHSSGPHQHFEIRINADADGTGVSVDPIPFMRDIFAPID